jgi:hypothetical protein
MLRIIVLALLIVGGTGLSNSPAQAQLVTPFGPGTPTRLCMPQFVPLCPGGRTLVCVESAPCAHFNQQASMCTRWGCIPQLTSRRFRDMSPILSF